MIWSALRYYFSIICGWLIVDFFKGWTELYNSLWIAARGGTTCMEDLKLQRGKNWILPKEINANRLFWLSLAGNLEKPLMSLYRTEWRERGYVLSLVNNNNNNNNNNNLFSIRYSNTLSYTIHKVLLYNIGIKGTQAWKFFFDFFCRNQVLMVPRACNTRFLKIVFDSAEIFDF